VFMARKFNLRPYIFPILLTLGIPFFLIELRSWRRWFHPERVPIRWPSNYAPGERLQRLEKWLGRIWMLLALIVIVTHDSMPRDVAIDLLWVAFGGIVWDGFLRRYIQDRKYIPPPSPPSPPGAPLKGWAETIKGIHSEYWGGRKIPKTD
jgi:hypothetical protein